MIFYVSGYKIKTLDVKKYTRGKVPSAEVAVAAFYKGVMMMGGFAVIVSYYLSIGTEADPAHRLILFHPSPISVCHKN
jgi:hypothetical protein